MPKTFRLVLYDWVNYPTHPFPSDYAICYFRRRQNVNQLTFASMILSVLLIGSGFVFRVVRLHKSLAVNVIGRARRRASERLRKCLRKLFNKCEVRRRPGGLRHLFIYRPIFALFLLLRIILDAWSSMFVEVSTDLQT